MLGDGLYDWIENVSFADESGRSESEILLRLKEMEEQLKERQEMQVFVIQQ